MGRRIFQESSLVTKKLAAFVTACFLAVIAVSATAYLVAASAPQKIHARAEMLMPLSSDFSANSTMIQTQIALLTSTSVLQNASDASGRTLDDFTDAVSVNQEGTSQVVEISVSGPTGDSAVKSANALITAYDSIVSGQDAVDPTERFLENEINALQTQLAKPTRGASQSADNAATRTSQLSRLNALQDQLVSAQLNSLNQGRPADVITAPYVTAAGSAATPRLAALVAFLISVALSGLFIRLSLGRAAASKAMEGHHL